MRMRVALALGLGAAGLSLGACADDMYGPYGYAPYGYGGGYYGAAYGGYGSYDGYGYGPYYGAGYGAYDPFGWYGDFYYPGVGLYVYDSYRRPHYWNNDQQRYWSGRRTTWQGRTGSNMTRENWSGFSRGPASAPRPHHG